MIQAVGVDHAGRGRRDAMRRARDIVEVFVELVKELTVVAGFGDVVPRRRIRGEEGRPREGEASHIEEFTRQRIGE